MARLVKAVSGSGPYKLIWPFAFNPLAQKTQPTIAGTPGSSPDKPDSVSERMLKYIPAEALITFQVINTQLLPSNSTDLISDATFKKLLIWWVACLIAIPFLARHASKRENGPWQKHALIACIAFFIWTYAMPSPIWMSGAIIPYDAGYASILLGCFSLISAILAPTKQSAD